MTGPINGLPPHLKIEDVPEAQEWLHNWLYSVVPAATKAEWWDSSSGNSAYHKDFPLSIYLAGYCRNCGKGFTQQIPHANSSTYQEIQLQVPKTGCVGPS